MKRADFNFENSGMEFKKYYNLQNIIDLAGKNLLVQWNIKFGELDKTKLYEDYFKTELYKPRGLLVTYKDKNALLHFQLRNQEGFFTDKTIVSFYDKCSKHLPIPAVICFIALNKFYIVDQRNMAIINVHKYFMNEPGTKGEINRVSFSNELPIFNKENLLKYVFK